MDGNLDLSALASSDGAIGNAVSKLLSRPDLLMNIASELGLSGGAVKNEEKHEDNREDGNRSDSPPAEPGSIKEKTPDKGSDDKKKLLYALRPYMSPKRREALDMMISLESIGRLVGNIDPQALIGLLGGGKNV